MRLRAIPAGALVALAAALPSCGTAGPPSGPPAVLILTSALPAAAAGRRYDARIECAAHGGLPLPERFELRSGALPPGLRLEAERDEAGAATGHARIAGHPRVAGTWRFTVRAVAPGAPSVAAERALTLVVGPGEIAILTPGPGEEADDPLLPPVPPFLDFVNPVHPQAFTAFSIVVAGGSGHNVLRVHLPRELVLSVFDAGGAPGADGDSGFEDGGVYALQAGATRVQVAGYPSPRGPVGTVAPDTSRFQRAPGDGGPPRNARRFLGAAAAADATLGTAAAIRFGDWFDPRFDASRYPFTAEEYANAFFAPSEPGLLRFRAIVEAIDTAGTAARDDDRIARRAYVLAVRIPEIRIDTTDLPPGRAGVDYTARVRASGGVPPLRYELEWTGDAPEPADLGLDLDADTGAFLGVPRASGEVELTVRVHAAVLHPSQAGVPVTTPGGLDGVHPRTGRPGAHRTFRVSLAPPSAPVLATAHLAAGVDGETYPGDRLVAVGGVPRLAPPLHGGPRPYPSATARRTYAWTASHPRDASHDAPGTRAPGLPRALVLDGDPASVGNGAIAGTATDRGIHPVRIEGRDAYLGPAASPDPEAHRQRFERTLVLNVGPDFAVHARGVPGAVAAGLADAQAQMAEPRMVPLAGAYGLHVSVAGRPAVRVEHLPAAFDVLPVMLVHGGDDEHVEKGGPSISGFLPAESGSEADWSRSETRAWQHSQQLFTWVQLPSGRRVFLWGETRIKQWDSAAAAGGESLRYQELDPKGRRGVLVVDPRTGDFWSPAILDNAPGDGDGSQFGAEVVLQRGDEAYWFYWGIGYWKRATYGQRESRWDREILGQGMGAWLQGVDYDAGHGRYRTPPGRSASSVAASADGTWMATALPGGDRARLLLWRTDKAPVAAALLARPFVRAVDGRDARDDPLPESACLVDIGGADAGGVRILADQERLLPDSLCFVEGGLLFLVRGQLDHVFGLSLADGRLSRVRLEGVDPDTGFYVPDQDYLKGDLVSFSSSAQFAFAGDRPDEGASGPDTVAFVAGANAHLDPWDDLPGRPRDGYRQQGNRTKDLFVLSLAEGTRGLDLAAATLRNLTAGDAALRGDLLPPGRLGEEQDYLAVSPDGSRVAVVRDFDTEPFRSLAFWGTFENSFGEGLDDTGAGPGHANDDLLLFTTDPSEDLDPDRAGVQDVLYFGTHAFEAAGTAPQHLPSRASGTNLFRAKFRRIHGVQFAPDGRTLIVHYAGSDTRNPKHARIANPVAAPDGWACALQVRIPLRDDRGRPLGAAAAWKGARNLLDGLAGVGGLGPPAAPFGDTGASDQLFWSTFRSPGGRFLYFVSDRLGGRNFLVGVNVSAAAVGGREPFVPFSPHAAAVGLEQIDVNAFSYESRFHAVPPGARNEATGRDGAGIVFFVASDAAAGPFSATDLEVYAFDADAGGPAACLSSGVTPGTANAINHLHASADGNALVFQRARTAASSRDGREVLNGRTDLCLVRNVHAALRGGPPDVFVAGAEGSHGHSVAFVGEGSGHGVQALAFSAAAPGGNATWVDRTLRVLPLAPGARPSVLDGTPSFHEVFAAGRRCDDDPDGPD